MANKEEYTKDKLKELIKKAKLGQAWAIEKLIRYATPFILNLTYKYYIEGGDKDDIIQEGNIALLKAVESYNLDSDVEFKTYMKIIIERQIINAVNTANRLKHQPLNKAVLFSTPISDEDNQEFQDTIASNYDDPQKLLESRESIFEYNNRINEALSILEYTILNEVLKGHSYDEIAIKIGKDNKAVDNAIQRIRKKLSKIFI